MKWLTLFTSLTLASTAAYFSIVGLMTIFSGAAIRHCYYGNSARVW